MEYKKIKSFTDLDAWRKGHELVLDVYRLSKNFPREEQFGLTSQIRRAAVSCTSNVAEGFSRRTKKDKIKFYSMALGSLTELQNQLLIARDMGYLEEAIFKDVAKKTVDLSKMTNGLIKSSADRPENT